MCLLFTETPSSSSTDILGLCPEEKSTLPILHLICWNYGSESGYRILVLLA